MKVMRSTYLYNWNVLVSWHIHIDLAPHSIKWNLYSSWLATIYRLSNLLLPVICPLITIWGNCNIMQPGYDFFKKHQTLHNLWSVCDESQSELHEWPMIYLHLQYCNDHIKNKIWLYKEVILLVKACLFQRKHIYNIILYPQCKYWH